MSLPDEGSRESISCHLVGDPVHFPALRLDFETMKGFAKSTTLCVALVGGSSAFVGAPLARSSPGLGIRGDDEHDSSLLCCDESQSPKATRIFVPSDIVCALRLRVAFAWRTTLTPSWLGLVCGVCSVGAY